MTAIKIKLNLQPNYGMPPIVSLKQYDKSVDSDGKSIEFELFDGVESYIIPSGATASIRGTKPDLTGFIYPCTISNNIVHTNIMEQMTVCKGKYPCEIQLKKGENIIGSTNFFMDIEYSALKDDTALSNTEIPNIAKAVEAYEKVEGKVEEAAESAKSAKASAESADASAKSISSSVESAKSAKEDAVKAKEAAVTASGTATQASASAKSFAEAAKNSASSASEQASKATSSASSASEYAEHALASATSAQAFKNGASDSEEKTTALYEQTKQLRDTVYTSVYPYNTTGFTQLEYEVMNRYESARTGKVFATKHQKFKVNTSPLGTKLLDSVGLTCTPSTDKVAGQDDFMQYLPFQWERVNYVRDEDDGFARPIAIEGRQNFKTAGSVDVGSMSATFWWKRVDDDESYTIYMSDMPHPELNLIPWCEAVKADGSVMPYYIGSTYFSGKASDGLPRSQPNLLQLYNQSHNSQINDYAKKGTGYQGCGTEYILHGLIFSEIKYGTPNIQQYAQGCSGYSFQTKCAVAEAGVKRVLLKTQWSADVGNVVSVGVARASDGNTDRGISDIHSKANRVRIASIEQVEIEETTYYALNLDCEETFDTDTDTIVSSMPCYSGETDAVIDHYDGSNISYTNSRHSFRLHGREYLTGQYFVSANSGLVMKNGNWHVVTAPKGVKHNTNLSNYVDVGEFPYNEGVDYWLGDWNCNSAYGTPFPESVGKSNALGTGDMIYVGGKNIAEGSTREYLIGGHLWNGSNAGLLSVHCWNGFGIGNWRLASRD